MKLDKVVLSLVLALNAMLATTGCRHQFNGKVTNIPGHRGAVVGGDQTDMNTKPFTPDNSNLNANPTPVPFNQNPNGTIPTTTDWTPDQMNQDHDKLAAYTVHFKFDSAVVQDSEQANVASVGQALTSDPTAKLLIEGNCDERGTEEYNRSLGERRALALREALAKDGIDPLRIRTISYGKDKPADPGHDEAAWAKNRRGDFVYCTPKTPLQ